MELYTPFLCLYTEVCVTLQWPYLCMELNIVSVSLYKGSDNSVCLCVCVLCVCVCVCDSSLDLSMYGTEYSFSVSMNQIS